jgi:hypothetical protein
MSRKLEQPENWVAPTAKMEWARRIVVETRDEFLRGELDPVLAEEMKSVVPAEVLAQWQLQKDFTETSKVNQQVRLNKLRHRVKNLLRGSANKSNGTRRFRPGKQMSTLRKQTKQWKQIKRDYLKTGGGVIGWEDFVNNICIIEMGTKPMYEEN